MLTRKTVTRGAAATGPVVETDIPESGSSTMPVVLRGAAASSDSASLPEPFVAKVSTELTSATKEMIRHG